MQQTHCEYSLVEFKDRTCRVRAILVSNQVLHFIYRIEFKYLDQESPFHYPGHQSINGGGSFIDTKGCNYRKYQRDRIIGPLPVEGRSPKRGHTWVPSG